MPVVFVVVAPVSLAAAVLASTGPGGAASAASPVPAGSSLSMTTVTTPVAPAGRRVLVRGPSWALTLDTTVTMTPPAGDSAPAGAVDGAAALPDMPAAAVAPGAAPDPTATPPVSAPAAAPVTPSGAGAPPPAAPGDAMLDAGIAPLATPTVRDPWQQTNRAIFRFNHTADRVFIRPVTVVWKTVLPRFVRVHISHGLDNLAEPVTAINDVLQLHIGRAGRSLARFVVNSTLGVAGLFDLATPGGFPAHPADFGQTLGRWGVHPGPYVVLPFFGPSDLRDGVGLVADTFMDPASYVIGGITSNFGIARFGARLIDIRIANDGTLAAIYEASDPYAFARSAYMQRRMAVVLDATGQTAALPDFDGAGAP